ncbi:MAG: FGGY-family carbohydrate kinase [Candidatus Baldrarchaeia archaeon]
MSMPEPYVLTIDAGTSGVRCAIFDSYGNMLSLERTKWEYIYDPTRPYAVEFNPKDFWNKIVLTARKTIDRSGVPSSAIRAIAVTGMRYSYVFISKEGKELYAGPNTDGRGVLVQAEIEKAMGHRIFEITGHWPPVLFALPRLLWFKRYNPEVFSKIWKVLSINDWVTYRLSSKIVSEPSNAAETMLLDIHKLEWSEEICEALGLPMYLLPEIEKPGTAIGTITGEVASKLGLSNNTEVIVGGADTQCAMLGAGVIADKDLGIAAGTTAPIQMVLNSPLLDPHMRIWTTCHVYLGKWILEANIGAAGLVYDWFKDNITKPLMPPEIREKDEVLYEVMEKLGSKAPVGSDGLVSSLGPQIMDARKFVSIRPSVFLFPQQVLVRARQVTAGHFIRSILENIAFAIRANLETICEVAKYTPLAAIVTGGMAKNKLFVQILSDVLGVSVKIPKVTESSSLGCAICAMIGIREYRDFESAVRSMVKVSREVHADEKNHNAYTTHYSRWKRLYLKAESLL